MDNTHDNSVLYTPVRVVNPEDISGGEGGDVTVVAFEAALPAGTNAIGKLAANSGVDIGDVDVTSVSPPSAVLATVTNVTTAGTRVALGTGALARGVLIQARRSNTGSIYVGAAATVSSSVYGRELLAGDTVYVECNNLNLVGLDSSVNGEGVSYFGS